MPLRVFLEKQLTYKYLFLQKKIFRGVFLDSMEITQQSECWKNGIMVKEIGIFRKDGIKS